MALCSSTSFLPQPRWYILTSDGDLWGYLPHRRSWRCILTCFISPPTLKLLFWCCHQNKTCQLHTVPIGALQELLSLLRFPPSGSWRDWCLTVKTAPVHSRLLCWLLLILFHFSHNEVSVGLSDCQQHLARQQVRRACRLNYSRSFCLHSVLRWFQHSSCTRRSCSWWRNISIY